MPDLAAGPNRFAIPVDLEPSVVSEDVAVSAVDLGRLATQHVHHDCPAVMRDRGAKGQIQYGAQVIFELRSNGAIDSPVGGVVRPHRQLVDQQPSVSGFEQFDGEDPNNVQSVSDPQRNLLRLKRAVIWQSRCWSDNFDADPIGLNRLDDRICNGLAVWRPGDDGGQLPGVVHELLSQNRDVSKKRPADLRITLRTDDPDTLAVVPSANCLEHDGPPDDLRRKGGGRVRVINNPVSGALDADLVQASPHGTFVLGVDERLRGRSDRDPGIRQPAQVLRGHVFVVEGEDVGGLRERGEVLVCPLVPNNRPRDYLGGGRIRRLTQHGQPYAQADRGRLHHPSQLAAPDYADHGKCHAGRVSAPVLVTSAGSDGLVCSLMTRGSHLGQLINQLVREGVKFLAVGGLGYIVAVGSFNLLRFAGGEGPLYDKPITAQIISHVLATFVTYGGNRTWTWRHRERSGYAREYALFFLLNAAGLGIAVACLAISHYVLGFTSPLADNLAANVVGVAFGTIFRFWSYRKFVFREVRSGLPSRVATVSSASDVR
jgi:putative flippase GtrA